MAGEASWEWWEQKQRLYEERLLREEEAMLPALEARIKQDSPETPLIVAALYHALQRRSSPWLWEVLWRWVKGPSLRLRAAALAAFQSDVYEKPGVKEALWEHARSPSPVVRRAAIRSLLNAMEAGLEFRPKALKAWAFDPDPEVRLATLEALEFIGEEHQRFALGLVESTLRQPEVRTRDGRNTHQGAIAVLSALSHRYLELTLFTLERLAPRLGEEKRRQLAEVFLAYVLNERYLGALPHLNRWLKQGSSALKQMLVWALNLLPEEPKLEILERLVRAEHEGVRREVVLLLEREVETFSPAGVHRAFAALNFAAAEGDPETQALALAALKKVRALMSTPAFREQVLRQRRLPSPHPSPSKVYELEE